MTRDELIEIKLLKSTFPYLTADPNETGNINGITPIGIWAPLDEEQLVRMKRLMFLLGKQEGEKSQVSKPLSNDVDIAIAIARNNNLYSHNPERVFGVVERALFNGPLQEEGVIEFFLKLMLSWRHHSIEAIKSILKDESIFSKYLKEAIKDIPGIIKEDSDAVQVKSNLYSKDPKVLYDEVQKALSRGPISFPNVKVFIKHLLTNLPNTSVSVLKEIKSEGIMEFKELFLDANPKLASHENIKDAFGKFVDSPGNDYYDIVNLINDMNDIAFNEITEEHQKEIVKHVVEEMN